MSQKTILITGANRGIGEGFVSAFLAKKYQVIAGVRDLQSYEKNKPEGVIAIKLEADTKTGASEAVEELKSKHGIDRIDIVLANAGYYSNDQGFTNLSYEEAEKVWKVNVLGPMLLYQATLPLLSAASDPKFIVLGSRAGVLGIEKKGGSAGYGQSKAAVHFLIRRLHYENPKFTTFALLPGHLKTDMGGQSARNMGLADAPRELSETLPGMINVIESSTREANGGLLCEWDGTISEW